MEKDILEVERLHLSNILEEVEPAKLKKFEESFLLTYTFDAVGLEGKNEVPLEEVKRLLKNKALLDYSEREKKEVLNHAKAYQFVLEKASSGVPFDEEILKDIHELLVEGIFQGGIYRNVNVQIIGGAHQPPDYVKVYDRMSKLFTGLSDYRDPLVKAVYAHAQIAKVHPFLDGNGRLARLVLNYLLIQANYLPITIPNPLKSTYIGHLETFKVEKNIDPLVNFVKSLLQKRYEEAVLALEVSA